MIEDTKYYIEELYPYKRKTGEKEADDSERVPLELWDLFVGAKVDIFGKPTILK